MSQWGKTNDAANSVSWGAETIQAGSGKANIAANNTALFNNTTPDAFITKLAVGQFGVSKVALQSGNTTGSERLKVHSPGWALRRQGEGGLKGISASGGVAFTNGETITISNGSVNATGVVTTNTGNIVSIAITSGGRFAVANGALLTYTFAHEKHVTAITVGGTPTGYNNTDLIQMGNGTVNATATVSTNATGGFVTANVTVTAPGLFAAAKVAGDVVTTVYAANGAASNGSGATFTPTLTQSSGGTVNTAATTFGGRAGRVTYETLAVVKDMANSTSSLLPNT